MAEDGLETEGKHEIGSGFASLDAGDDALGCSEQVGELRLGERPAPARPAHIDEVRHRGEVLGDAQPSLPLSSRALPCITRGHIMLAVHNRALRAPIQPLYRLLRHLRSERHGDERAHR